MQANNTTERWGWVSQGFHWLMVLLILGNFGFGLYLDELERSIRKLQLFTYHKSIGLTVLTLAALRLIWRWSQPTPRMPEITPRWQHLASRGSHVLLYVLMFGIPIAGWVTNSAANVPLKWFGWISIPSIAPADHDLEEIAEWIHWFLAWTMIWLVVVHASAALKHHFIDRDSVLVRMLPFGGRP